MAEGKMSLFGDWKAAKGALETVDKEFVKAGHRAMLKEANFLRGKIIQGFREGAPAGQAWAPLAQSTLAIRKGSGFGGTKILVERGDLRNSIKVVKMENGGVFIGILRAAKSRDGKSLINIAKIHEEGTSNFVVPITPKSRAWYHAMLKRSGMSVTAKDAHFTIAIIQIKARPFIRPVFEKYANEKDVRERFYANIFKDLAGPFAM